MTRSIHQKGFDSFTTTEFPQTAEALGAYDVVMFSDIGANTLLLHPDTFERSEPRLDRLVAGH